MTSRNWDFYARLLSWALMVIGICAFVNIFIAFAITNLTTAAVSEPAAADAYLARIALLGATSLVIGVVEAAVLLGLGFVGLGAKST